MYRRTKAAGLAGSFALLLAGCGGSPAPSPEPSVTSPEPSGTAQPDPRPDLGKPEVVATGLDAPWSIAFHDGTPLLSERDSARIVALDESGEVHEVAVLDVVDGTGEGGLLGIAAHQDHLYVYFTAGSENRIERHALAGAGPDLSLGSAETILDGIPAARVHNGGRIAFGPDDMLYATTGDAGNTSLSQDLDSLAGKILRLTPDGDVPEDNPFDSSYVYSYGHRNPQGLAWDEDGTLYASEFGQNTWDELNVIEPGGDYGWPEVEGIGGDGDSIDPVQQWEPAEASPSGMAIVGDHLYVANLRGTRLREVPLSDLSLSTEHYVGEYGRLRDAVIGPEGDLWILTNNTDGRGEPGPEDDRVLRIELSG